MVISSVSWTSWTAARIEVERSLSTWMPPVVPSCASNCGSMAWTRSTTSTVLAPGWRWTASTSERWPSKRLACCVFSTELITRARSPRRIG